MNQEQIYDLLWKRLEPFGRVMSIEDRTEFDGNLWDIACELAKEKSCAPETFKV